MAGAAVWFASAEGWERVCISGQAKGVRRAPHPLPFGEDWDSDRRRTRKGGGLGVANSEAADSVSRQTRRDCRLG